MNKHTKAYGNIYTINEDLKNLECWNLSGNERFTIKKGAKIEVIGVYDSRHTSFFLLDENNQHVHHAENESAYKFIVNNVILSDVINVYIPTKTFDLIGELINY